MTVSPSSSPVEPPPQRSALDCSSSGSDRSSAPGRHLRRHDRAGHSGHPEDGDGRPGAGRHHRDVPEPGPPERGARTRRVPRARHRLPPDHVHDLIAAFVLPALAETDPGYVDDVIAAATGGTPDRRHRAPGGVPGPGHRLPGRRPLFGIALFRARVLARWAAVLLAVGGVVTVAAVGDAGRVLPAAGLPERHRHDRPRLLAVEHARTEHRPDARDRCRHVGSPRRRRPLRQRARSVNLAGAGRPWSRSPPVPVVAGTLRLVELSGGAQLPPAPASTPRPCRS